jgi:hypothetical protein
LCSAAIKEECEVALPDGCERTATHLVFWELATEAQLDDTDKLYEFCCTVSCTNGLRPLGPVDIVRHPLPDLSDDEVMVWGGRSLTAPSARGYAAEGYVLCELRLPIQPMGAPVPHGISVDRPLAAGLLAAGLPAAGSPVASQLVASPAEVSRSADRVPGDAGPAGGWRQ